MVCKIEAFCAFPHPVGLTMADYRVISPRGAQRW